MKPLPDLADTFALVLRGRRSVLMSARNEAAEALRDAAVACQSAPIDQVTPDALKAIEAAERLMEISSLWSA